jgi:hypothetical protein
LGNRQRCPFDECGAAGLGIDIYHWDDWAERAWPTHQQLRHGMRSDEWRKTSRKSRNAVGVIKASPRGSLP